MKHIFTLALLILACIRSEAQMPLVLSDDTIQIGSSMLPALSADIPEVDYDITLKEWVKNLESGTKSKVVTENGVMSIFGANIKKISANPINVYSTLTKYDEMVRLSASFEPRKDEYITKDVAEADYMNAQNYLKEFAKDRYIDFAKGEADAEEKKLRDLQKELSSLEREKSKMQRGIRKDNTSILREQENIVAWNNELRTLASALALAKQELSLMDPGPAQKEKQAAVRDLEKRQRKAKKSIESAERKIKKANSKIDGATKDIPKNENMQGKLKEEIAKQEAVFRTYDDKLQKIKSY